MSVPLSVVEAARTIFADGFTREAQQLVSRFKECAEVKTGLTGKTHAVKVYRKGSDMQLVTGRLQDTNPDEAAYRYRYLFPKKGKKATIFDEDDGSELGLSVAPTGDELMEHVSAAGRFVDDIFIAGILGTVYEGEEDNMQSVAFDSNQVVAVGYRRDGGSGNTGLTLAKLIAGKSKFGKNEVSGQDQANPGKIWMGVSQDQLDDLLYDVEQTGSSDYNNVKALVNGEVDYFMGIHFKRSERLPTTAASGGKATRTCPMWISNGVRIGMWADLKTNIDILANKDQAIQIYSRIRLNALRKDENTVVKVNCEYSA